MRTYLLITGAWLAAAAVTAYVYARLAGFAAGSDAHTFEPRPGPRARRRASSGMPGWVLVPLAMGCAAAVLMADFALAPETRSPIAQAPSQSVRMAEPEAAAPARRSPKKPRRDATPRSSRSAAPAVAVSVPVSTAPATAPVAATPVRSRPQARRPQPRTKPPASQNRPKPTASPPAAVAAAVPTPSPSPVPAPPAPAPAQPEPAPERGGGPPPHAKANGHDGKEWTVHPPSKQVPGRVHRSKAPAGRPRCACR